MGVCLILKDKFLDKLSKSILEVAGTPRAIQNWDPSKEFKKKRGMI